MESPFDHIARAEIGGVPCFWAPQLAGLPYYAALVARTGRCDETLRTSGITHLIEHLALPPAATPPVEFNGMVDNTTTSFWFTGPPDDAIALLEETAAALASLPLGRLERELGILRTESESHGSGGLMQHAMWLRFGSVGHGLGWHEELGLWWLGAGEVTAWAHERFSRGNVAIYLTGEPSPALDLALRQSKTSLSEVLGRTPQPVTFVNSFGLGDPPELQKFVCGKKLYNYDSLEPSERKLVL